MLQILGFPSGDTYQASFFFSTSLKNRNINSAIAITCVSSAKSGFVVEEVDAIRFRFCELDR